MRKLFLKSRLASITLLVLLGLFIVACSSKKSDESSSLAPEQKKNASTDLPEEAKLVIPGSYLPEQSLAAPPQVSLAVSTGQDQCLSYFQQAAPLLQQEFSHYEYQNSYYDRLRETNELWRAFVGQALNSTAANRASASLPEKYVEVLAVVTNELKLGATEDLLSAYIQRLRGFAASCRTESKEKIYQIKITNEESVVGSIILSCERDETTVQDIVGLNLKVTESDWLHLEFSPYGEGQQALGIFSVERPYRKNLLSRLDQIRGLQFTSEQYGMSSILLGLDRSELTPGFYLFGLNLHRTPKEIIEDLTAFMDINDVFYSSSNAENLRQNWKDQRMLATSAIFYQSPFVVNHPRGHQDLAATMRAERNFLYGQLMPQNCFNQLKYDFWSQLSPAQQELVNFAYQSPNLITDLMEDGSLVVRNLKPQVLKFQRLMPPQGEGVYFNASQRQALFNISN